MGGQIFAPGKICTSTIRGGRITQSARTAMWLCLYCLTTAFPAISGAACPEADYDETSTIKYIVDGDTVHLKDGRKVRLIGINTPEVARGTRAAEPFAAEAKNVLSALFKENKTVSLVYGEEKFDHYDRLLAHVYTAGGKNVQTVLLKQGYARSITFPPNSHYSACYLQQEREARCSKKGLWKKIKPLNAKKLDDTRIGFQLVKGKLVNININKKGIWLNLDNKLTVGIRPDNQPLFDINRLYKMLNQKIVVRGWLNKNKKASATIPPYYIRARHPSSLQLADTFACH
jgi:endonuclease YncB( thermonuclease family)